MDQHVIDILVREREAAQRTLEYSRERWRLIEEDYAKDKAAYDTAIADVGAVIAAIDAALAEAAK